MAYTFHNNLPAPYYTCLPGIYAIVNRNNHKIYIGSATNVSHRWAAHRNDFFKNRQNPYFMRAFRKDPEAFFFEVIEELPGATKDQRLEREQFWLDFYRSYIPQNGYNASRKATSCEGVKHGPEYGAAMSKRLKGRKMSPERLAAHTIAMQNHKGRSFTQQQKDEQSRRFTGMKCSDTQRRKYKEWRNSKPNYKKKPIIQMSMSGEFIRRFDSALDAEKHFGKRMSTASVCLGKTSHCEGFKWKYA